MTGSVQLPMPEVHIENSERGIATARGNNDLMMQLEAALEQWINVIAAVIEQEGKRKPAEVCFSLCVRWC